MKQLFTLLALSILCFLFTPAVQAQIKTTTDKKHKKEQKRFLREARKTESAYKETHLNTSAFSFKKGEAGRKRAKKREDARLLKQSEAAKPASKKQTGKSQATKKQAGG